MSISYDQALSQARKVGASRATDAGTMALFCADTIQLICGAVSPRLVWEGAQRKGLTALELSRLANQDPTKVHDLMW